MLKKPKGIKELAFFTEVEAPTKNRLFNLLQVLMKTTRPIQLQSLRVLKKNEIGGSPWHLKHEYFFAGEDYHACFRAVFFGLKLSNCGTLLVLLRTYVSSKEGVGGGGVKCRF